MGRWLMGSRQLRTLRWVHSDVFDCKRFLSGISEGAVLGCGDAPNPGAAGDYTSMEGQALAADIEVGATLKGLVARVFLGILEGLFVTATDPRVVVLWILSSRRWGI
jgi:hypothetical protein